MTSIEHDDEHVVMNAPVRPPCDVGTDLPFWDSAFCGVGANGNAPETTVGTEAYPPGAHSGLAQDTEKTTDRV